MTITDQIVHERRVFAQLDEQELLQLIAAAVAQRAGIEIDTSTQTRVTIGKKDRAGTAGYEHYAKVELLVVVKE